jgi:hypothetical protein
MYTVLTNTHSNTHTPYRVHSTHDTMEQALAVATRLMANTTLEAVVELPNNQLQQVPFNNLQLQA